MASFTYTKISREDSENLSDSWRHCVHMMIHTKLPPDVYLFEKKSLPIHHTVMMQMRFDGRLGFPGGFVDAEDPSLEHALYREFFEEMGDMPKGFTITPDDYLFSHRLEEKKYCLNFYSKEVEFEDYKLIEKRNDKEPFEGFEVLGAIRVPLYLFGDRGGFPAFLKNNFVGFARTQLLDSVRAKGLLPEDKFDLYVKYSHQDDPLSNSSKV